jgi:hypothetical protein
MARDIEGNSASTFETSTRETNIDLNLQPGITLSGIVVDTKGAPVSNVSLDLGYHSWRGDYSFRLGPRPLKTDAQGSFSIPALPHGLDYEVLDGISAPGYGTAEGGHLQIPDTQTNHYQFPAFVLKVADRPLAGQVIGSGGKPVAGAVVEVEGPGQPNEPPAAVVTAAQLQAALEDLAFPRQHARLFGRKFAETDAGGHFSIQGLCGGPLSMTVSLPVSISGNIVGFANPSVVGGLSWKPIGTEFHADAGDTNVVIRLGAHN